MSMNRIEESQSTKAFHRFFVGIDAGSVSLNCVVIDDDRRIIYDAPYRRHFGRIEEEALELMGGLLERFGEGRIGAVAFTGSHGKALSEGFGAFYEFETISQILGALFIRPDVQSIISMGGQDTALFQIKQDHQGGPSGIAQWELEYFNANGPCASGTGSFLDQQAQRLATSIYSQETQLSQNQIDRILKDFIELGMTSERPSNVACRCTVFTKSDMIHLQNKGEKLEDIIYGLHVGNARNYLSTIVSNRLLRSPILFIGGLSMNPLQVKAFRAYFPDLIIPPHNTSIGALGVALQALTSGAERPARFDGLEKRGAEGAPSVPTAPRLEIQKTHFWPSEKVQRRLVRRHSRVFLGIDVGSTTTKYALINEERQIIHKDYVPTQGKPVEVTQRLLRTIRDDVDGHVEISGVATTGSGRSVVGDFLNADLIIDEITAHARGAVEIDPTVDTIFEIGGQDSKYISIVNTHPLDFDMNKVCAAGTGSFLHELANKYGINIVGEFQDIALSSETPVKLAERCTVFMESDLVSFHQKGVRRADLMGGLCYAIVHNYLNRVVGKRKVGHRVMFLGGPSLNRAVVAAFEKVLGRGLIVPAHREVMGAFGAALCVQERMNLEGKATSDFRGLDQAISDRMEHEEKICQADPQCHNQCKLKIYDFDGRRSVWGGECGRYEVKMGRGRKTQNLFELRERIWAKHMADAYEVLKDGPMMEAGGRPTVGMQRALYGLQSAILWAHFFDRLGYRLVLTPPTNAHIAKAGIETMVAETCFPVKVSHGHVKELVGMTKYLFLPVMINMPTPVKSEVGYYCPMVQSNAYMVRKAVQLEAEGLLSPIVYMKCETDLLALELARQLGSKLGLSHGKVREALEYALGREKAFQEELYLKGKEILEDQVPLEPIVIVTGRPYNLYDERLNLRIGQNLAKIGMKALPMDFVDVSNVDLSDFSSMYWGLGAHVLRTAKFIKERAQTFGLHLTNFGCGPDSFVEHFYKHIMGERAYLILELDEHSAVAGVMTRLEAYKHVIENSMEKLEPQAGLGREATR
jgi:predicted CoA-substrate-specific enzyme activase